MTDKNMDCGSIAQAEALLAEFQRRLANSCSDEGLYLEVVQCRRALQGVQATESGSFAQNDRYSLMEDKALRFDLDQAGIEQREAEAVELVTLRARVAELVAKNTECRSVAGRLTEIRDSGSPEACECEIVLRVDPEDAARLESSKGTWLNVGAWTTEQESVSLTRQEALMLLDLALFALGGYPPNAAGAAILEKLRAMSEK